MRCKFLAPAVLVLFSLVLAGCADTIRISSLLADPARWNNKTVRIVGTVQNSMGLIGHGAYSVSDGTGTIWVISGKGVPSRGAEIAVEGDVFQGAQVFGQSVGVALKEKRHRAR